LLSVALRGDIPLAIKLEDLDTAFVWQACSDESKEKIIKFWRDTRFVDDANERKRRVNEVTAVAFHGEDVVGVSSVYVDTLIRNDLFFGFFRAALLPAYQQILLSRKLYEVTFDGLSAWVEDRPRPRMCGIASVFENKVYEQSPLPVRSTGASLVGFSALGQPTFVKWFDHARY